MSRVATMARALLYLRVATLAGQVKSRLRRLQQPKYLAGALVGTLYVYFTFLAHALHPGHRPASAGPGIPSEVFALLPDLGALVLLIILVANWAALRHASLAFSEAEIAFLFPAPVDRRMLVHYQLLSSQLGIVLTALILTAVSGRSQVFGGNPWFHAIGLWLILATLNLHFTGTSFAHSKFLNRSMTPGWQKAKTAAAVWVAVSAMIVWAWTAMRWPRQSDLDSARGFAGYVGSQLHVGPLPWLLWIPKALEAPYFADSTSAFLLVLGPALAVLVVHYFWVVHTVVSFEEASIAQAEKRATRTRRVQQGDWRGQSSARRAQRSPFNLLRNRRPEVAFLWKNLLSTSAIFRPRAAIVVLTIVLGGSEWLVRQPALEGIRIVVLTLFGVVLVLTLLLGPTIARQDLRADLPNSDILKTYPLRGWQVVLGELLTPLSILSGLIWICLLAGFLLLPGEEYTGFTPALRCGAALGLAVLAPPLVAIQLLVPNAAALIFPAWAQSAADRTAPGIEVMGQRIIFMAGQLFVTAIAAVPAVISAALVFLSAQWLLGRVAAAALGVATVFLLFCVEAWLGVRWLGDRFDHFDFSAEL